MNNPWEWLATNAVNLAGPAIALVALGVSVAAIRVAIYSSRASSSMTVTVELFREFRSPEMIQARHTVLRELKAALAKQPHMAQGGFDKLPTKYRDDARRLSHFFDNVGLIVVGSGYVNTRLVVRFLGMGSIAAWEVLKPVIDAERHVRPSGTRRIPEYQGYFEDLRNLSVKWFHTKLD